jgi:hypothetical protein
MPARRGALAAAAVGVAVASRGDAFVLAALLAILAPGPPAAVACVSAMAGSVLRWGSSSLGAIAGGQAALGPAGWTGPGAAVVAAWAGAAALLASAPALTRFAPAGHDGTGRRRRIPSPEGTVASASAWPFGLAAAAVAAGPGPGGASLLVRVVASLVGIVIAVVAGRARGQRRTRGSTRGRWLDAIGVVAGAIAVVAGAIARA